MSLQTFQYDMIFLEFGAKISLSYTFKQPPASIHRLYFGTSLTLMFLFRHNMSMSVSFSPEGKGITFLSIRKSSKHNQNYMHQYDNLNKHPPPILAITLHGF